MRESFRLALRALLRGHVLTLLLATVALVHALFPSVVRADGTADGWREMFIRSVPGFVVSIVLVVTLACACGVFSRERETNRLALTVARPAPAFFVAAGRWLALCAVAAVALALNAALTFARFPDAPGCRRHLAPILPPPVEVARQMMDEYLADPATPEAVKKAPRHRVLELLTNKEKDRYDAIAPNASQAWTFETGVACSGLAVRVSLSSASSMNRSARGTLTFCGLQAPVSNDTQALVDIPLAGVAASGSATNSLVFANTGKVPVMLRPRRDIELLLPADSFLANLIRSTVQSLAVISLLAAFGIFLSAALSRPVAVFTALVVLVVALMAPDTLDQFPEELEISPGDRMGLVMTRGVTFVTGAFVAPSPVADLATGRCIEWPALSRTLLEDLLVLPAAFLSLSALLIRRRPLA
ncbi:MAG: hypothetical protein IJ658_10115 [Kiritimatiellae bacterium]|nr:hypothetical protein [Kiritimatiellia bacterium]